MCYISGFNNRRVREEFRSRVDETVSQMQGLRDMFTDTGKQLVVNEAIASFKNGLRMSFEQGSVDFGLNLFDVKVDNIKRDLRMLLRNEPEQTKAAVDALDVQLNYMKRLTRTTVANSLF